MISIASFKDTYIMEQREQEKVSTTINKWDQIEETKYKLATPISNTNQGIQHQQQQQNNPARSNQLTHFFSRLIPEEAWGRRKK